MWTIAWRCLPAHRNCTKRWSSNLSSPLRLSQGRVVVISCGPALLGPRLCSVAYSSALLLNKNQTQKPHQQLGRLCPSSHIIDSEAPYLTSRSSAVLLSASSLSLAGAISALAVIAGILTFYLLPETPSEQDPSDPSDPSEDMSAEILPGRPGNLTPEQEDKLRQIWTQIFQVCGVTDETIADERESLEPVVSEDRKKSDLGKTEKEKKKKRGFFSRKGKKDATEADAASAKQPEPGAIVTVKEGEQDKHGQIKAFYETLRNQSPESIHETIWGMVRHDHPDALVLRFLRARKWDVDKALIMLISTMNWRAKEMHVDDDIMKNGEAGAVEAAANSSDPKEKTLNSDFLGQARMGKSFVHGIDGAGRPICIVRVRLHRAADQVEESLERYTVYLIETARLLLTPPVDTANILFDMTGFSLANMDYTPIKFMIKCFEANYPESLGVVLVHKAPWIFQGIWKIIRGWLDPVVAAKVHFTNNRQEIEAYIPAGRLIKELEGEEDWEYQYVEPIAGENDKMKDTATRNTLLAAWQLLVKEYETATLEWIKTHEGEAGASIQARRNDIAKRMREHYWEVDPYIRARSWYDRTRVLSPGGKLEYYPAQGVTAKEEEAKPNGTVETSPDDVD